MDTREELINMCRSYEDESPDEATLADWLNKYELGDVRFEIDIRGRFLGSRTLIAFGGPNVWLYNNRIEASWGVESVTWDLCRDVRDALFDNAKIIYDSRITF